jgi:short-subunit dehydrogenase
MHKDVQETSIDDVERVLRINFLGAVHMVSQFLPGMVEQRRGFIVNVGSVAGQIPNPKETAYGAAKAALHNWTHGLNLDLHGTGVHAGLLSPGPIDTEIWDKDETPSSYTGKKYPPEVVAIGAARMIEKGLVHLTVPRRYGAVGPIYALPLLGRAVRVGLVRFEEAGLRRRARDAASGR